MAAAQSTADGVTGSMRRRRCAGDISGAFADGAILFPLRWRFPRAAAAFTWIGDLSD